jgi:phosphatidylglycerophosphate synthase
LDVVPVDDEGKILDAGRDRVSVERTVWFVPVWLVAAAALFLVLLFGRAAVVFMGNRARKRAEADAAAARSRAEIEEYEHDGSEI